MVSVVVAGARTPMGRMQGALSTLTAPQLAGVAIRAALERSGLSPADVDQALVGQVLQAGVGQSPARQAAVAGGLPMTVPATAVNKVCLSGLDAVAMADALIRAGMADVVVVAGTESMSQAPHLLPGSRSGHLYGDVQLLDHMAYDGLRDTFTAQPMGTLTEQANDPADPTGTQGAPSDEPGTATAARYTFTREEQDAFAARSHRRAAAAWDSGVFADEVVPVEVPQRRGAPVTVERDEGIRPDTTVESLGKLRPAFRPDGTITAGSSSPISDGAAAVVVARRELVEERGLPWLAEVGAFGTVAGPDSTLQTQPSAAIREACRREGGTDPAGLDRYEINEAFAAVGLASAADLGLAEEQVEERLNVHGGAIALGHPIGMSGTRLVLTLALELRRSGGGLGAAALCGGGGQGSALLLRVPRA